MKTMVLAFVVTALCGTIGCRTGATREELVRRVGAETLVQAAWKTHGNFIRAKLDHASGVIPATCWEKPIQELKPLKVFLHHVNVVVVTKESREQEEGLYFYIPISSYAVVDDRDGFTRTKLAPDIWAYRRLKP